MKSSPRWVKAHLETLQWIQSPVFITLKEKTTEKNRRYLFQNEILLKNWSLMSVVRAYNYCCKQQPALFIPILGFPCLSNVLACKL